jgi:hypothetical protein
LNFLIGQTAYLMARVIEAAESTDRASSFGG